MTSSTSLPPEWAPQSAVMLTWPRADGDFSAHFDAVEQNFVAIAVAIAQHAGLHVNVAENAADLRARLLAAGVPAARLRVFEAPNDDVWARDHGPITVIRDGRLIHLDFRFNGWGGKFPAGRDDALTRRLAAMGAWAAPVESVGMVLEGGGIDVDGAGSLLTTERCLLAPTRNPSMDCAGIEAALRRLLGVERILWLKDGDLLGDDTDGHIDTLARFCDAGTIAYQACEDRHDPHYALLAPMAEELAALRKPYGTPYRLMPFYGQAADEQALARLRECFPARAVRGIDCRALIQQYGSLHCVTMQIPQYTPDGPVP